MKILSLYNKLSLMVVKKKKLYNIVPSYWQVYT